MSVQNSPPISPHKQKLKSPIAQYSSDPVIDVPSRGEAVEDYFNITKRQKHTFIYYLCSPTLRVALKGMRA